MMTSKPDWTTALGQAYAMQSSDVMASVQHLRSMAHDQGNLVSTAQQNVVVDNGNYVIVPAQPQVIYVPVYDPVVIYTRPVFYARGFGGYWSFGVGFPIGGWLSYDCDWRGRRVYYQGWDNRGYGYDWWRARSRPYVRITNVYVNPRYANVYVNRGVEHRSVNYGALDHYNGVHRDVHYAPAMGNDRDHGRDRATPPGRPSSGFDYRTTIPTTVQPRVNGSYDDRNAPRGGQGRDGQSRGGSPDGGQRGGQGRPQQPQPQPQAPRDQPRMQPEAPRHEQQPVQQQARPQIKAPQPKHDEKRPEGHDGRRDGEQSQFRRG
jgi:hypothetical protein